jgi:hypothetical protein
MKCAPSEKFPNLSSNIGQGQNVSSTMLCKLAWIHVIPYISYSYCIKSEIWTTKCFRTLTYFTPEKYIRLTYSTLEISTRGHEYEKGYRIKNVVTFLRRQFPGKQQCWCQIWRPKSGMHVLYVYVWKVWCKSGQFVFKILTFDPQWP